VKLKCVHLGINQYELKAIALLFDMIDWIVFIFCPVYRIFNNVLANSMP